MHTIALCHHVKPRTMSWWSKFQGYWASVGCLLGHFTYSAKRGPGAKPGLCVLYHGSSKFGCSTSSTYATRLATWKLSVTHMLQHCKTPSLSKLEFSLDSEWKCVCIITNVIWATVSVQSENHTYFQCVFTCARPCKLLQLIAEDGGHSPLVRCCMLIVNWYTAWSEPCMLYSGRSQKQNYNRSRK